MPENRSYADVRAAVARLCADFPGEYWRDKDREKKYPSEFVSALTEGGYLSVLIPEEYGGAGMDMGAACAVLEEIQRSGGNGGACHAQMYTMGTLLRHGSATQKQRYLPEIASGKLRLQAFGVTEPSSGTDTTRIRTKAVRDGDDFVVSGQKVFISRVEHSDLMLLLVRTTPRDQFEKPTLGMSVLLVDLRDAVGNGLTVRPLETMLNHATTELFFDQLRVPARNLIGEEGKGFGYILDGMNAERILIAAECIGDARWFIEKAGAYANEREVFGAPIGKNQGNRTIDDTGIHDQLHVVRLTTRQEFSGRPGLVVENHDIAASEIVDTITPQLEAQAAKRCIDRAFDIVDRKRIALPVERDDGVQQRRRAPFFENQ